MGATVKKVIWGSVCFAVVLLLGVYIYQRNKSRSEPRATDQPQSALAPRSTPAGPASSSIIGLMGGLLKSSDGRLAVSIPPGALSADTAVSIQPLTDTEGIAVGPVYQLLPEGSIFAQPVTLTWQMSDTDLAGHPITELVIATRNEDGAWGRQRGIKRDPAAKTIQVATAHFSVWSAAWIGHLPNLILKPEQADVVVAASLPMSAFHISGVQVDNADLAAPVPQGDSDNDLLATPVLKASPDDELLATPVLNGVSDEELLAAPVPKPKPQPAACVNWRVNGKLGGNSTWGTISAAEHDTATFVAPAKVPSRNPVVVSCEAFYKRAKIVATANVTIKDKVPGWHGHLEYTYSESHTSTGKTVGGVNATSFATESRTVTGEFDVKTDYMGWGSLDGTGTGKAEVTKTDGMRNPICGTDGGSSITGDVKIGVGGSANAGAGTLSLSASSDNLQGETHLDNSCTKPSSHQSNEWTASFGVSCTVTGIDFVKGGTYTAEVPSDNGHGKCKVTISPN